MHTPDTHEGATTVSPGVASGDTSVPLLPPPPAPSTDPGLNHNIISSTEDSTPLAAQEDIDIFTLSPLAAMKILCSNAETLVRITGDVPPTPPISHPSTPKSRVLLAGKEGSSYHTKTDERPRSRQGTKSLEDVDSVPERAKTPIGSPEAAPSEALHIIGSNMEPLDIQRGAISRKFYSKKPPPISVKEYLSRLHHYCPMSTATYLATSLYIHRLAVVEKILPVTTRNAHRLLLAGLRVAMKALEDLSYPHARMAKVGGVTEIELGRLEVSFCFVMDFDLKVDEEMLHQHAMATRDGLSLHIFHVLPLAFRPKLPPLKDKSPISQNTTVEGGSSSPCSRVS